MNTWAVIPVKPLRRAKSRLGSILSLEQRAALVVQLFEHTLDVLSHWEKLSGIMVVSASQRIWEISEPYGVEILKEARAVSLNHSLEQARLTVIQRAAGALLIVAADIPGLNRPSLVKVLDDPRQQYPGVVIAPDRAKKGTNVMLLSPPEILNFCYGPDSFSKHQAQARQVKAAFSAVFDPCLNFDVDTPEDYASFRDGSVDLSPCA